jgi:gamma-glutamyltranspeptidase/glutathione hydrolase
VAEWAGPVPKVMLGRLPQTLKRLAEAGPGDFYTGRIARDIIADARRLGIRLTADDLASYTVHTSPVGRSRYRGSEVDIVPGLTAGPTLRHALSLLETTLVQQSARPDPDTYAAYADCLFDAYKHRLAYIGDVPDTYAPSCTTHISVADREGNVVALTITLLSLFGSKVMLPDTGILMNNGIMWFDPRPDRPNSIQPGRRPLSNMCPAVLLGDDGRCIALGASGGRRIMPAVFQLISYLIDYGMTLDEAIHYPRLDVSGTDTVTLDSALPNDVLGLLAPRYKTRALPGGVYPNSFACPSIACHDPESGTRSGATFVMSPWAAACAEPE